MGRKKLEYALLVEGKNDKHVIWNLAEKLKLKETFYVEEKDSYTQLLSSLPTTLKSTNILKRLGVIVDADENLKGHWDAIRDILVKSGFYSSIPEILPKNGLICYPDDDEQIIFGLWIMPNNNLNGMLEDFIGYMIPNLENNSLLMKTDEVLTDIEANKINNYKKVHHSKARIHTWLAWQDEPGTAMGTAITKQILSTDGELCCTFASWLKELFDC